MNFRDVHVDAVQPVSEEVLLLSATVHGKPYFGVLMQSRSTWEEILPGTPKAQNERLKNSENSSQRRRDVSRLLCSSSSSSDSEVRPNSRTRSRTNTNEIKDVIATRMCEGKLQVRVRKNGYKHPIWVKATDAPAQLVRKFQQKQRKKRRNSQSRKIAAQDQGDDVVTDSSVEMPYQTATEPNAKIDDTQQDIRINEHGSNKLLFQVKWKGFSEEDCTWEPEDHLPAQIIEEYEQTKNDELEDMREEILGYTRSRRQMHIPSLKKQLSLPENIFSSSSLSSPSHTQASLQERKDYNLRQRPQCPPLGGKLWNNITRWTGATKHNGDSDSSNIGMSSDD
eukprot:gene9465-1707_t